MTNNIELKTTFLEYYQELPIQKLAAAAIGKDEDTIIRWRHEDADFADQVGIARATWALEKVRKVRSPEWVLERVLNDHFAPQREAEIDRRLLKLEQKIEMLPKK